MKNRQRLGIYIHIPFCVKKCAYCDFLSFPATKEVQEKYMSSLESDIKYCVSKYGARLDDYIVDTVFFGGGTPSYVSPQLIAGILKTLKSEFVFDENPEISIECNPGTIDDEKMRVYAESGFNRCSIGLQSVQDDLLKQIGRIHTFKEFEDGFSAARNAGFKNINIDVMSALPGQSVTDYVNGLKKIIEYKPEHISAYSLIVEEGTPVYENPEKFLPLPSEDDEREMYYETDRILKKAGFDRYEISNYSKKGFECRHNVGYWERKDYLGFGLGASSLFENVRMKNISDMNKYIGNAGKSDLYEDTEILTVNDCMEEFMFLGLRMMKGVSSRRFLKLFNKNINDVYAEPLEENIKNNLLCKYRDDSGESWYCLTPHGIDISNTVMADFML